MHAQPASTELILKMFSVEQKWGFIALFFSIYKIWCIQSQTRIGLTSGTWGDKDLGARQLKPILPSRMCISRLPHLTQTPRPVAGITA